MLKQYAIRGATTVTADTVENVDAASLELIKEMVALNAISPQEAVSLTATITPDIRSVVPVKSVRLSRILGDMPVFCCSEPDIIGALPFCIRFMLHIQTTRPNFTPTHAYINGAKNLQKT